MDEYDSGFYAKSPKNNPIAGGLILSVNNLLTSVRPIRVLRGGSWLNSVPSVSLRRGGSSSVNSASIQRGFRCATPLVIGCSQQKPTVTVKPLLNVNHS